MAESMTSKYHSVLLLLWVSIDIIQSSAVTSPSSCKSDMCNDNGECKVEDGKTICICNPMYTGLSCEINMEEDCFYKGDCATKCPPTFSGKECACLSLDCGSNGICVERYNGTDENVFCKCFGDYEGDRCDHIAPTGFFYIYKADNSSALSSRSLMSAVIGASTSIAVMGLVALFGIITLASIWKIRKVLPITTRGMALNEDHCQDQDNKDDSISVVADQNLEMVDCETIQTSVSDSCLLDLPLLTPNDQDIQKDSICHEDSSLLSYPVLSKLTQAATVKTNFIGYCSREFGHRGGEYSSDLFSISVPHGSIPEDTVITVSIGITFCTELMLLLPPRFKAVSPVVELCVKEQPKFKFLKPVTIRIQHYLDICSESSVESMSVHFLKSGHNLCCFHLTDGREEFPSESHYGVLSIDHFCSFCIAADQAKVDPSSVYCYIMRILPRHISSSKWDAVYCICLYTCSIIVEKQYKSSEYEVRKIKLFKFHKFSLEPPYLEVNFDRQLINGWNLSLQYSAKITAAELDYTVIEPTILECMERDHLYPPRYTINISGRNACSNSFLEVQFTGLMDYFKTELLLESPDLLDKHCTISSSIESQIRTAIIPSHIDLMNRVAATIPTKWRNLGIQLGLPPNDLDVFEARHGGDYLRIYSCIFMAWEKQVTKPFTWEVLISSLKTPLLAEYKLAEDIQIALYPFARESLTRGSRTSSSSSGLGTLSQPSLDSTHS